MNSKKSPIIAALVFLGCLIAGFVITTKLKPDDSMRDDRVTVVDIIRREESFCDTLERIDSATRDTLIMESCTSTIYVDSLTNRGDTIPGIGITGEQRERKIGRKIFIPIPPSRPIPTKPILGPTSPRPIPKPDPIPVEPKPKMSKSEFQGLINNTSDNILEGIGNDKVSGHVKISVSGKPSVNRVSDVREKIETGMWKGVRVISLESDQTGKITGATVEPM